MTVAPVVTPKRTEGRRIARAMVVAMLAFVVSILAPGWVVHLIVTLSDLEPRRCGLQLRADANLLIALSVVDHIHHEVALGWLEESEPELATCPITEGSLLRFMLREGSSALDAVAVLDAMRAQPWHSFWPDQIPYEASHMGGVIGHRQVTDAYLVALARHRASRVATLDQGLAALHGEHVHLLTV